MEDGATVTFIKNAFSGIAVDQAGCTVHSGTTATDITINKNGDLCVYDNGSAISATVNAEGEICVFSGGSMNSATVNSRGNMLVCAGGSADVVTVNVCGGLVVSGGGTATQVLENGGYVDVDPAATVTFVPNELNGLVFENDWDGATIHSGTTGIDLTFNKGNGLTVFSGGFVKNITLGYDIGLGVSSGGKVTGKMTFDAGARVTAYDGGILDFDLRETAADADALLNNLSVVKGDPTFTLTVTGSEAYGTYKLAESATGFDKTITVVNTLGETLGTLTVAGGRKLIDGRKYMLNLDESSGLSVTISDRIDLTGDLDSEFHLESDMVGSGVNVLSGGALYISSGAEADHVTVNFGGYIQFWDASGTMTNIKENGGYANTHPDATVTFLPNSFGGYTYSGNSMASIHSGTIGSGLTVCSDGGINVFSGGVAQNVTAGSRGEVSIRSGGTVDGITISSGGRLEVLSGGKVTGKLTLNDRGVFSTEIGSILDFDLTQIAPGEDAPVNDLSGRQIMSSLTLTVDGTEATGDYNLVGHVNSIYETRIITVENKLGEELGTLTVAEGTKTIGSRDYTLTIDSDALGVTISDHIDLTGDLSGEFELEEGMVGSSVNILNDGYLRVSDGGSAEIITVNPGGTLYVSDGGSATGIVAEEGALLGVTAAPNTHAQGTYAGITFDITDTASGFTVQNGGALFVSYGGFASDTTVKSASLLQIEGGTATGVAVASGGVVEMVSWGSVSGIVAEEGAICNFAVGPENYAQGKYADSAFEIGNTVNGYTIHGELCVLDGGTADDITVNPGCRLNIEDGGKATNIKENGGAVEFGDNATVSFVSNTFAGVHASGSNYVTVHSGTTATDTTLSDGGRLELYGGGVADGFTVSSGGELYAYGGKLTGKMTVENGAEVEIFNDTVLDFDLTQAAADADALVNDLEFISHGCPSFTLTVSGREATGSYKLAGNVAEFNEVITVKNTSGENIGTLTVGEKVSLDGTDYLLTNENGALSVSVEAGSAAPKWTYLVYMATDNDICFSALYDIISMQQAAADSEIDIYVLADRTPAGAQGSGDLATINGTYRWGSDWEDTRVGKITYSPGLTVTVDWTSWGELDTGSIETLERFVDWAQEESPAENYGLILWDHGEEDTKLCWDLTTDRDWDACFTVSEVAGLLKEKGNIPIVIFNACLLGSELTATQMAGSTDVIVVSEPSSYGLSTFNYSTFFRTITPDMTPQEMAAIMVRNVEPQSEYVGEPSMLSAVDVTDSRLGDALEALAVAVSEAGNDADKDVLIHAMLQAPQDGSDYDGTDVQQSDLGFMIRDAMADPDYAKTSEGFRKALADVRTALELIVLEYRSVPAKRGSGIAVCNSVCTAKLLMTSGATPEAAGARVTSYLVSTYDSNPLWGGLLNDLCATYLAEIKAARVPNAVFSLSEVVVDGRTVIVSDLGGFSGRGELFDYIKLRDERFFGFVITAPDKSTGSFTITSDVGAAITVSLLAADGTEVATGTGSVSFQDLAVGTYYLRLQSETDCRVTISSDAGWWTGVDRFEGNDSYEIAAEMGAGYHTGLITCDGDPDYYLIGNYDALLYTVEVYGEEGWTVGEYDPYDDYLYEADYADGKYTMMMGSMGYLLVEGTADLANGVDAYSVNVIPYESEWPEDITLDDLAGTQDGVSWEPSILMNKYYVEYSPDDFAHTMRIVTTGTVVDLLNLPSGTYQWRVTADSGKNPEWFVGEEIVVPATPDPSAPKVFRSSSDANDDLFFATPKGTWDSRYAAKHTGFTGGWTGTGEIVSASGKGRIQDLFFGSADPGTLYLTDSENGDALFLDDVFTGLPEEIEENTARLFRLHKIIAGAGDDIINMTSQRFEYSGGSLTICGGDGDDVIWASRGSRNTLFGDAGNDRLVGASGDDVIVGGIGDDRMHGGGGNDIFTFCDNWGVDTVEQLATGTVTLWFISGSMENWDSETLTYSDGENSVTVSGVSADQVALKFEHGGSRLFASLINLGAFSEDTSQRIYEKTALADMPLVSQ